MTKLHNSIRVEDALLLWCVRKCSDVERNGQIEALIQSGIDWSYLMEVSSRHGLLPLLLKYFESNPIEGIPREFLDGLTVNFRKIVLWNLARTRELLRLLDLFDRNGIQAIPYKGPILAQLAYGDLSLRQFDDLDIFVLKRDLKRVKDLLLAEGYRLDFNPTEKREIVHLKSKEEYSFYNDKNRILVEIHWQFLASYYDISLNIEDLFNRLKPISLFGKEVKTFSPEDLLLILCVHGGKHCWQRLSWVLDVANLLEAHKEIDWNKILDQACKLKIERFVLLGIFLAKELIGIELPEALIGIELPEALSGELERNSEIEKLSTKVYEKLFNNGERSDGILEGHLFHLRMIGHWMDRAKYCLSLGFTPNIGDWEYISLPESLFPLYYLVHPLRLATECGRSLSGRVFGDRY